MYFICINNSRIKFKNKLSDKDIGRLMNVVKNKGIQGVIDSEDTGSNNHARD